MTPEARIDVGAPLPVGVLARAPSRRLPFPLDASHSEVYARARHGLWHAIRAIGLRPGDAVLVPAYHHGSEVEALQRAGIAVRFYAGDADGRPDADELERLLLADVKALYLIHCLGFPQESDRWRAWCDARDLLLVEDAAQAWLAHVAGRPVGAFGDAAIYCLYKTLGVPDGGAVVVQTREGGARTHDGGRLIAAGTPSPPGVRAVLRRQAGWALQHSATLSRLKPVDHRPGDYDADEDFALGDVWSPACALTHLLVPRLVGDDVAALRRANYSTLLEQLADLVPQAFADLPAEASPFAFPIEVDDKPAVLERLASANIAAVDFWSVPHPSLPVSRFPDAARRRATTVLLPVHQELDRRSLDRIAAAAMAGRRRAMRSSPALVGR